ncbi:TonB-dependent receptor [Sphingobacteriaceae bacterium WQ 2009]|uniref:TonB-dependent receptor n=1 Tax=Rhinopithecimicrobium faecis TaxID=2820698 RepID=A0A8T4H7N0_9SPHI|nr:TonB-dependent receptor [Sphingobacteriaceae bacterium WQ 2009]
MRIPYLWLFIALFFPTHIFAQSFIKGTIIDSKSQPIANASLRFEKTTLGTSSKETGNFELQIPVGTKSILQISAVGFLPQKREITISDLEQPLQIQLMEDHLNLNEVVISATRNRVNRREAPVIVNVLSPKLFAATQSVAMSETLNYQPGVRIETNCQNCGFTQVRLNGLEGAYSQILINSRSIFSALNSVYGLDQIPTSMIERIEVVRSGGSALFGANAIAGTINIITKDPIENDWSIKSTNSLIGGRAWDNTVDFNTSLVNEDLMSGVTFYGMNRNRQAFDANRDGFSEITKLRNTTFGAKAFYKTSENNKITFDFSTLNEFRRGGDQLEKAPHFTDITEQIETNSYIAGLTYDHYFKDFNSKLSLYSSVQKSNRNSYYGGLGGERTALDSVTAANAYGTTSDFSSSSGVQYTHNFERDVLTVGAEFTSNNTADKIPGYERLIDQKTKNIGSYAQYEWKPTDALKTLIGARYDYSIIDGTYNLGLIKRNSKLSFGTFSPRLTVLYDIIENLQFRGGYARGFRAPQAFNEDMHVSSIGGQQVFVLMGENLKTEYSNAYTGSFNYSKSFGNVQTSFLVEGFYTQLQNPFTTVLSSDEDGLLIQEMQNGENGKVYGTNVEINIAPSDKWTFQAGGTIQRSRYKSPQLIFETEDPAATVSSKQMLRSPNTYGFLTANWKPTSKLAADLTSVYTGSMLAPHIFKGERMELKNTPQFLEVNLRLGYTFSLRKEYSLELSGGVQNIFNAYQKDFDRGPLRDSDYIYGPSRPRTYTLSVKIGHFH